MNSTVAQQLLLLAKITTASNGHDNCYSNQASFCNLALQQHPILEMKAKVITLTRHYRCQP